MTPPVKLNKEGLRCEVRLRWVCGSSGLGFRSGGSQALTRRQAAYRNVQSAWERDAFYQSKPCTLAKPEQKWGQTEFAYVWLILGPGARAYTHTQTRVHSSYLHVCGGRVPGIFKNNYSKPARGNVFCWHLVKGKYYFRRFFVIF